MRLKYFFKLYKNIYFFYHISLGVQGRRPSCYELPSFSRQGTLEQEAEQRGGAKLEVPGQGAGLQGRSRSETQVDSGGGAPSQSCSTLMQVFSKSTWQQVAKYKWM